MLRLEELMRPAAWRASARRSARRSEPNTVPTCLLFARENVADQYENRARGCENIRKMPGDQYLEAWGMIDGDGCRDVSV